MKLKILLFIMLFLFSNIVRAEFNPDLFGVNNPNIQSTSYVFNFLKYKGQGKNESMSNSFYNFILEDKQGAVRVYLQRWVNEENGKLFETSGWIERATLQEQIDLFDGPITLVNKAAIKEYNFNHNLLVLEGEVTGSNENGHFSIKHQEWDGGHRNSTTYFSITSPVLKKFFPWIKNNQMDLYNYYGHGHLKQVVSGTFPAMLGDSREGSSYYLPRRFTKVFLFGNSVKHITSCYNLENEYSEYPNKAINFDLLEQQGFIPLELRGHVKGHCILLLDHDRNILLKTNI